jgi:CubicO group peptidase (beta-lactamase class C family)
MRRLDAAVLARRIEARAAEDIAAGNISGAAVAVWQDGCEVFCGHFGTRAPESEEALTEGTVFRLASMTKPITGVAIMRQIEKGLVSLDDTLDRFIPEYAEMDIARPAGDGRYEIVGKAKERIRILHLLTHTSGVGCGELGNILGSGCVYEYGVDLKRVADEYSSKPISFEPYTAQAYSGRVGFDLLARVVEITSDMPCDEFLKKEIFEPLEMKDTTFTPSSEQWGRAICMYQL